MGNSGKTKRPNILILWGDDVGYWNISANNHGLMGYKTPNIDRLAREGIGFTDYYAQQSCTAGRAAFITGQNPYRTGLTKVGIPGAELGLQKEDPTIAELLKPLGYSCGQFGKNHLGDKDEFLPNFHGFDEFFGNLYHLNAEEEPEHPDYPKGAAFKRRFGPRGVLHCVGDKVEDTGPLNRKRMETIDQEVSDKAMAFMEKAVKEGKPFFLWWNATHMHFRTHIPKSVEGKSGQGPYNDAMCLHDEQVGALLDKLDELGVAEDTIVMYSTDNGPHYNTWPDAGITPFRSEKNTNWEGAFRVPCFARWPGHFPAGQMLNGIVSHQDWLPTLLAAAGDDAINEKLKKGYQAGDKKFKVHIDGYNMLPYFSGQVDESPREFFMYVSDDGDVVALRYQDWKFVFMEQRAKAMSCWAEPFVPLRLPKLFNLRRDPCERADENANVYWDWLLDHSFLFGPAQLVVAQQAESLVEFPPRQKPASFNLDTVMEKMQSAMDGGMH